MNKTIKVKQLVEVMPQSARLMFCEMNCYGDAIEKKQLAHVGDYDIYSTYMEKHIKCIEIQGSIARVFI